jgi:hypothetical protein
MAILLIIDVMDRRAIAVVAAAVTVERLAPAGERVARRRGRVRSPSAATGLLDLGLLKGVCSGIVRRFR